MKEFNTFERAIAKGLETFPRLRVIVKEVYKRLIYGIYRQPGFRCELHSKAVLKTPESWAGLTDSSEEKFFGYYDKSPWSTDMKLALFHTPSGDEVDITVLDRHFETRHSLGSTKTWNWQQGAMAQWISGGKDRQILFNDSIDGVLGCRIVSVNREINRFVPWPVQALHPRGHEALALNYRRLQRLRPDYGYSTTAINFLPNQPLDQDGIWRINLNRETADLIISLADLKAHQPSVDMRGADHKVNHLFYSPSGKRFVFLHRFVGSEGKFSRLFVARSDGSRLRLLMDARMVSHYCWKDDDNLLVWGRTDRLGDRYYLIAVDSVNLRTFAPGLLEQYGDGHCSFSRTGRWMLTDTYPDRTRQQKLLLFDTHRNKVVMVGRFLSPWKFAGPFRCDLHPRFSADGRWISIDSAHNGRRGTYFIDVSRIIN